MIDAGPMFPHGLAEHGFCDLTSSDVPALCLGILTDITSFNPQLATSPRFLPPACPISLTLHLLHNTVNAF